MLEYGRIFHSADRVLIVASGPSLRDCGRPGPIRDVSVIAVNGGADLVWASPDIFFTADARRQNRTRLRRHKARSFCYAAVPPYYGDPDAKHPDLRDPPEHHVTFLRRLDGDGHMRSRPGLSADPTTLHGGNSAYAALGLAFLMGARRIALLGVDATHDGYAFGHGRPIDLSHLPELFASAVPQLQAANVEVVNGSPRSRVVCFPRMSAEEACKWLSR